MNDEYDLQALLDLRQNERDQAEQRYADEIRELDRRKSYLANKRDELQTAVEERKSERRKLDRRRNAGDASIAELEQFRAYLRGMKEDEARIRTEIDRAKEAVDDQRARVEVAREKLGEATRELKAVERHRDDWEVERQVAEKREEAARMDDIAARIWRDDQ